MLSVAPAVLGSAFLDSDRLCRRQRGRITTLIQHSRASEQCTASVCCDRVNVVVWPGIESSSIDSTLRGPIRRPTKNDPRLSCCHPVRCRSVFAAAQLKPVLWSSYRAHAGPPSCRVVHRYPLIVCHFGVECKFATACAKDRTQKTTTVPQVYLLKPRTVRTRYGQGGQAVRRQGRVRNPLPRAVRCAARPIGGGDDLPSQRLQLDDWHGKPKHLRVIYAIYAKNLTVEGRQYANTVMLNGDFCVSCWLCPLSG